MKLNKLRGSFYFIFILLAGCVAAKQPEPSRDTVKIIAGGVYKNCHLQGKVSISEENIYGPSHRVVQEKQLDQLRSQAVKLGANVINITSHKTKYYEHPEYIIADGKFQWELDAHAISGLAYRCPTDALRNINSAGSKKISDVRAIDE